MGTKFEKVVKIFTAVRKFFANLVKIELGSKEFDRKWSDEKQIRYFEKTTAEERRRLLRCGLLSAEARRALFSAGQSKWLKDFIGSKSLSDEEFNCLSIVDRFNYAERCSISTEKQKKLIVAAWDGGYREMLSKYILNKGLSPEAVRVLIVRMNDYPDETAKKKIDGALRAHYQKSVIEHVEDEKKFEQFLLKEGVRNITSAAAQKAFSLDQYLLFTKHGGKVCKEFVLSKLCGPDTEFVRAIIKAGDAEFASAQSVIQASDNLSRIYVSERV